MEFDEMIMESNEINCCLELCELSLVAPQLNSFLSFHFSSLPNGKKSWEWNEKREPAAQENEWAKQKWASGLDFGWVSGGTAARQPAKGKDEQPTWVERFHFSRSTNQPNQIIPSQSINPFREGWLMEEWIGAEWMVAFLWFPWLVCSRSGLWAQQRQWLRPREDKRQERNQREGIIHESQEKRENKLMKQREKANQWN